GSGNRIGQRRWRGCAVGPEDCVEAIADPVADKCGERSKGRGRRRWGSLLVIRTNVPEDEVTGQPDGCSRCCVAHFLISCQYLSANAQSTQQQKQQSPGFPGTQFRDGSLTANCRTSRCHLGVLRWIPVVSFFDADR